MALSGHALSSASSRRGRRYRLGSLPALALIAVFSTATSLAAITRFISGYDPGLRTRAGPPGTARLAAGTLGRLLSRLDGDAFDAATCTRFDEPVPWICPAVSGPGR